MTWETMTGREPGWYRDPAPSNRAAPDTVRYWDGNNWTAQVRAASKRERRAWTEEATAAVRAEVADLVSRAEAGDVEAQLQLQAGTAPATEWTTSDGATLSGWWRRVAAYLVDVLLASLLGSLFAWRFIKEVVDAYSRFVDEAVRAVQVGSTLPDEAAVAAQTLVPMMWLVVILAVVGFVYEVGFLKAYQATPGKMLLGIEVRMRARPGPLSWRAVLLRWVGKSGAGLLRLLPFGRLLETVYNVADSLWPLGDPNKQALHDKLGRTIVVRR